MELGCFTDFGDNVSCHMRVRSKNFKRTLASTTMRKQRTSCVGRLACPNGFVSTYSRVKAVAITERDGIRAAPILYEWIWRTLNAMKSSLLLGYIGACDARQFVDGYHKWNLAASVDDTLAIRVL